MTSLKFFKMYDIPPSGTNIPSSQEFIADANERTLKLSVEEASLSAPNIASTPILSKREFPTQSQCYQFLQDNYVFLDTALKRHAERRNGRVIILGCGDRAELSEISSDYDRQYGRG